MPDAPLAVPVRPNDACALCKGGCQSASKGVSILLAGWLVVCRVCSTTNLQYCQAPSSAGGTVGHLDSFVCLAQAVCLAKTWWSAIAVMIRCNRCKCCCCCFVVVLLLVCLSALFSFLSQPNHAVASHAVQLQGPVKIKRERWLCNRLACLAYQTQCSPQFDGVNEKIGCREI